MNICILLQDTGSIYGAERATIDLIRGLAKQEDVRVCAALIAEQRLAKINSGLYDALCELGIEVLRIPVKHAFSCVLIKAIRSVLCDKDIHIVQSIGYKANVHATIALRGRSSVSHVAVVHGWLQQPDMKERFYAVIDRWALRRCHAVVVLSNYYKDYLASKGVRTSRLRLIHSGIDSTSLETNEASRRKERGRWTIGMLGRLSYEKNHAMLLDVAHELAAARHDVQFIIAGEGPLREKLEHEIRDKGLTSCISMKGYTERSVFFDQIDLLVSCSRIENLPYTMLEAMARGKPIVSTDVGGVRDLITHGETGLLVAPGAAKAMAQALQDALADEEQLERIAANGRACVASKFSVERMLAGYMTLYRELLHA